MTDRIDLDELTDAAEEQADRPNRGDWLWRDEGDPDDGASPASSDGVDADAGAGAGEVADDDAAPRRGAADTGDAPVDDGDATSDAGDTSLDAGDATADVRTDQAVPHVPRPNEDKPVGIPIEGGGAGGGQNPERESAGSESEPTTTATGTEAASGPHGGGVDDMTTAFTYGAVTRLAEPARAVADASQWSDWVGIVGDVEAYVINKFQRDHGVDVDFFNGSGTGPGERLAAIDEHSMFFAERMVVVGVEGEDEPIAREADWEFVPLSTAAGEAGWELAE